MRHPLFVLAAFVASAQPALAIVDNFCRVTISPNFSGGSGPYDHFVTQPGTIDLSGSATGGASSSGSATSHVTYGVVRITAVADVSVNSSGTGYIRDVITVTAPGVPTGATGTLTYSLRVAGAMSATSGASAATWTLQSAMGGGTFDMNHQGHIVSPELGGGFTGDAFGVFTSTVPITFGTPLQLAIQFSASAQASNGSSGLGHAQLNSPIVLTWEGISAITRNGSPVPTYTVSSQTGTHYQGPISGNVCGSADFNCDGDVGTDADIEAFFACLAGSCPALPCTSSADFNGDGDIGTDADIESFFRVLGGGAC